MQELAQIIKQIEIFHGLSETEIGELTKIARREIYQVGAMIIEQGTPGDNMYIIAQGQVEVRKRDAQGSPRTELYLGEGQVFGELALLDQGLRSASIIADEDPTVVYALARAAFEGVCRADTALGYKVMRNIALDLAFKLRHQNLDE
jgi:CRP-like cAMP-binding protein